MLKKTLALIAGIAGLSLAAAADAQQQPPQVGSTLKATHGSWEIRCAEQNPGNCAMVQVGNNSEGQPVLQTILRKTPGATGPNGEKIAAIFEVVAPIGVYLPAGVGIKIDGAELGRGGYTVCYPQLCLMSQPVADSFITKMKAGNSAIFTLTRPNGQTTDITISLSGFTAAFNGL